MDIALKHLEGTICLTISVLGRVETKWSRWSKWECRKGAGSIVKKCKRHDWYK